MYLTCNSFSPGTHESYKWNTFTLLEINNLHLWENCTRWKQNICGFMKCYNFTADVKNFIWDIWSNSASKFNHHPLADNTSVNTSVAYLSSLNLNWENTEGLLWLFSEAKNLFLKVFLEGHSLFFSSFKLLENDIFPSEVIPLPLPLTLENASLFSFDLHTHSPAPCPTPAFSWVKERLNDWVCPRLPGFWHCIIGGDYQLADTQFVSWTLLFQALPFWNNFILDYSLALFWYCNFCIA